jgi:hypothetical protein
MDLDRITHPLRLARGSHQPGSAKGCAMIAISYINGDEQITDFPATSARPLASFVQLCNDLLAGPDGYLSPEDSLVVVDLGWLTVGTADVADDVMRIWVTKLLISHRGTSLDTPMARRPKRSPRSPSYTADLPLGTRRRPPSLTRRRDVKIIPGSALERWDSLYSPARRACSAKRDRIVRLAQGRRSAPADRGWR